MRFLFPLTLIIISGVLFFAIVDPLYNETSSLRSDVAKYNVALTNSTDLQKKRDSLLDIYKNIKTEDKDRLERFLPNTVNNIRFILEIEQLANMYSMPIKNIKFDAKKTQDTKAADGTTTPAPAKTSGTVVSGDLSSKPYGTFPIEFTTEGTYENFSLFLKAVEHNLRLVDVSSISFVVPTKDKADKNATADPNIFTYTLKVETYWLK